MSGIKEFPIPHRCVTYCRWEQSPREILLSSVSEGALKPFGWSTLSSGHLTLTGEKSNVSSQNAEVAVPHPKVLHDSKGKR